MKRLRVMWILALILLVALPTGSALASSGGNPLDRIVTGDDFVLDDGEREDGNVVVLGGSVEIREGAILDGDLSVMGGDVEIGGHVTGNVIVLGGDVDILEDAYIEGDCVLVGGDASIAEGAQIDGDVVTNPERGWFSFERREGDGGRIPELPAVPELPELPELPSIPEPVIPPTPPRVVYHHSPSFAERIGGAFLSSIAAGILALLIALFAPRHTDQVRQVIVREPVMSGLVGFLTFLVAVLLTPILAIISLILVLVCIGLLGFPLIVLMWLVVAAAALLGSAAIGQLVGGWLIGRLRLQGMTPAMQAGLGAFTVALVLGLVQAIGCVIGFVGGLLSFAVFCLALGAVVLTRFGRQDYRSGEPILPKWPSSRKPPVPPAPPSAPEAPRAIPVTGEESGGEGTADEGFEEPPLESEGPFPER
jgi:cytoskeletal protein CcmA (bactofilin family)